MPNHAKRVTYSSKPTRAARAAHARGDREFRTYDTSYIQPKKSNAPVVVGAILALIVVLVVLVLFIKGCSSEDTHVDLLEQGVEVTVVVDQGETAQQIGDELAEARLVSSSKDFVELVTKQNAAGSLIPGTYVFVGGTSPEDILHALVTGPASTGYTLTIPEGYTRKAIAAAVEQATNGHITADQFLAASEDASVYAKDYAFLASAGTNSLEGFLFPKTYSVTVADDAQTVVRMMLNQFQTEIAALNFSYPQSRNMDIYAALKLASIVEKEAAPENRATVASVFYNRLASDRPYLESDATTAYEVGHDPTAAEVHANTSYSTYTNAGLPPTPICSPSLECLQAVCNPEETDYLFFYFAPDENGKMIYSFSETYEDHQNAIG